MPLVMFGEYNASYMSSTGTFVDIRFYHYKTIKQAIDDIICDAKDSLLELKEYQKKFAIDYAPFRKYKITKDEIASITELKGYTMRFNEPEHSEEWYETGKFAKFVKGGDRLELNFANEIVKGWIGWTVKIGGHHFDIWGDWDTWDEKNPNPRDESDDGSDNSSDKESDDDSDKDSDKDSDDGSENGSDDEPDNGSKKINIKQWLPQITI